MCAPHIMQAVNRKLSRRDLLKSSLVGGAALASAALVRAQAQMSSAMLNTRNLADLTHTLNPSFPVFPGFDPMSIETLVTVENDGFYANRWSLGEHTGTHMDAPAHFIAGAVTADKLELEQLLAPLAVIDISERAAQDPDAQLTLEDVEAWESDNGELPPGVAVMMYSGWEQRLSDPESFLNADADGTLHFPGFDPEAAEFLVSERDIAGVGVDTLSLDYGASQDFAAHVSVLGAGKWGLENVANLSALPAVGAHLIVGGLKVENASGGPVRLIAAWG